MIIVYIIIGYLISVVLSVISDIIFILLLEDDNYRKKSLKSAETIGDFLNKVHPYCWIPVANVAVCLSNILLGFLILICKILTTLRDKFLNIRIK